MNKKKYIEDKYLCVDNCNSETPYEYNNICYERASNITYSKSIEIDDTTEGINIIPNNRTSSSEKNKSSILIFLIIGGVIVLLIIFILIFFCKNKICKKKKELDKNERDNSISTTSSDTTYELKIMNNIKVIFNDNKNISEIYADPEATMEEIIKVYIEKNKIKHKLFFLCNGKNILIESKNEKIKKFNKFDENKVIISVFDVCSDNS